MSEDPSHPPPSSSGPPPAEFVAWGPVRDAVTAIHNLETLLRSPRVGAKALEPVLPEVLSGVRALHAAFGPSAEARRCAARDALSTFTIARLDELDRAVVSAQSGELDARARLKLEQCVARVSVDVDASAELLDLVERADHAATTDLSLAELSRTIAATSRAVENEIVARLEIRVDGHGLVADPHVLKRLLAFAVARAYAHGSKDVTLRVESDGPRVTIDVGPSRPEDVALTRIPVRLVRRIEPTDAVVAAAARAAHVEMITEEGRTRFALASAPPWTSNAH